MSNPMPNKRTSPRAEQRSSLTFEGSSEMIEEVQHESEGDTTNALPSTHKSVQLSSTQDALAKSKNRT